MAPIMKVSKARTEIYFTLSELFKPPTHEFSLQLYCGDVKKEVNKWLNAIRSPLAFPEVASFSGENDFFTSFKNEYTSLFEGPVPPFAPLVESVYKKWDATGNSTLGNQKGFMMGDAAQEMIKRYALAGIAIPKDFERQPDHLSLLLEYMAVIIEKISEANQFQYINAHLDWIGDLFCEVEENRNAEIYLILLGFLKSFIYEDAKWLNGRDHRPVA